MLVGRGDDLVARTELEPGEDDVASVRRARGEGDVEWIGRDERADPRPHLLAQIHRAGEVRHAAATLGDVPVELASHGVEGRCRDRAERPRIQVGDRASTGNRARASSKVTPPRSVEVPESAPIGPFCTGRPVERVAVDTSAHGGPNGRASPTLGGMRVVIADPPAYTPPYDHALAAALVTKGVDVRLLTSRFRYGAVPRASGYAFDDSLYRLSSRIGSRHGRLVAKALEHPLALARLGLADCDLLHLQWVSAPEADTWLLHARAPLVFTAHDLLPRRTARHTSAWRRLFARFDRVVVHSERGRRTLAEFGVSDAKLRVIRHPAVHSETVGEGDGRTVLALGVIRPYKGLPDAVEAVLGVPGARLLVAGDPRIPLDGLRASAGERAEWRLGYLDDAEIAAALGAATVAVFPYRAELDQSGALLQASEPASRPSSTTSAASARSSASSAPAGSCRRGRRGPESGPSRSCWTMRTRSPAARAGAARARANSDLGPRGGRASGALRGARVRFGRRGRFHDVVERQLDLFAGDDADLLSRGGGGRGGVEQRPGGDGRGGVRRLSARRRRDCRPSARDS